MTDTPDEEALVLLVRRAQAGEVAAFDRLVRCLQNRAVGAAWRLLRNRQDAEDAAQEAFVQLWHELPRLREPQAIGVFLRRLVFKYSDRIRRARQTPTLGLDAAEGMGNSHDFDSNLLRAEARRTIEKALTGLPPSQRQVAWLRYGCEWSLADIAAQTRLPLSTVKNRLFAARKRLRKELWEMADEILRDDKPSDDGTFTSQVLAQIMQDFERQMYANPHLADRAVLTHARSGLEGLMKQNAVLDFQAARYGFDLLLRQNDWDANAALLLRFLDDERSDSETAWAYVHLGNALAVSGNPVGAVLAHQAFERWIPGRLPRLSQNWPYLPAEAADTPAYNREEARLLYLSQSVEFGSSYLSGGRLEQYLSLMDAQLKMAAREGAPRGLRFTGLRIATAVCLNAPNLTRALDYVGQMYQLLDEAAAESEDVHLRLLILGDHLNVLRVQKDVAAFDEKAGEIQALLDEQVKAGKSLTGWVRGQRHDLAHQMMMRGSYGAALPLWEENARTGGQMNGWGYLLHAGAVWHETGDRERTLTLLRDAAAHDDRDLTSLFRERTEFAGVSEDTAFLAAIRKK